MRLRVPSVWAAISTLLPNSLPGREDLPSAFARLASNRAAGTAVGASDYSRLFVGCANSGRWIPVYRLYEEALQDGVRLQQLSRRARRALRGRLPPDAEAVALRASPAPAPLPELGPLLSDTPPPLWVAARSQVAEFDGTDPDALARAWEAIARREAPVLIRGVGSRWPAVAAGEEQWSLPMLSERLARGMVRVAPGPAITFCRESHPAVQSGEVTPPSRTVAMGMGEFVARLHARRGGLPPLLYDGEGDEGEGEGEGRQSERCYLQALAPHAMMRGVDFSFLPGEEGDGGGRGGVLGRLWVSAPGSYSPLHFDEQDSYLCQVRGLKRMLLWPEEMLPALRPFPDDHPLARRLEVDVYGEAPPPELADAPSGRRAADISGGALEAHLRPGDVLYFPRRWAHHTEALLPEGVAEGDVEGASFSLGFRTDGGFLL